MTLAWLQAQYEAMGLQPGGPDGQWLQPIELKRYTPARPGDGQLDRTGRPVASADGRHRHRPARRHQ